MSMVLALTRQTGRHLAEVGFLLVLFAGIFGSPPHRSPGSGWRL
jgi:hypothetical protein